VSYTRIPSVRPGRIFEPRRAVARLQSASPLLTDLFAYYKLDEASGTATDSLGSRNLTAFNSPVSTTGKIGNARAFVAASSQRLTSAATDFPLGGSFSFAFWFNTTTLSVGIMGFGNDYNDILVTHETNKTIRVFKGGLSNILTTSATVDANTTAHLAVTFDSGTNAMTAYVNGVAQTPVTNSNTPTNRALTLGYINFGYYTGWIDELPVASRCWTPSEVALLYNSGSGRTYPF
jgi:hypothetical protein